VCTGDDTTRGGVRTADFCLGILIFSQEYNMRKTVREKKIKENKFDQVIDYAKPFGYILAYDYYYDLGITTQIRI